MRIKGYRTRNSSGGFEAYIPLAGLQLSLDPSMDYAKHIADLIIFEVEYKFKRTIDIEVVQVSRKSFALEVELCSEFMGWLLAERRLNSRLSQYALAKALGRSSNVSLSRFEHAERIPSLEFLEEILNACGYALELNARKLPEETTVRKAS